MSIVPCVREAPWRQFAPDSFVIMSDPKTSLRDQLRELERSFIAFEKGEHERLYGSRDALSALSESVLSEGWPPLADLCQLASRLIGVVLMERGLTEVRAVEFVREIMEFVERQIAEEKKATGAAEPGGVFHVVNSQRIGDHLLTMGLVTKADLDKALVLQRVRKGRRVGEVLVAMNVIDQKTLDLVLDEQRKETRLEESRRVPEREAALTARRKIDFFDQTAGETVIPPLPASGGFSPAVERVAEPQAPRDFWDRKPTDRRGPQSGDQRWEGDRRSS